MTYEDDYLYGFVELVATCLSGFLVYLMRIKHKATYQVGDASIHKWGNSFVDFCHMPTH